MIIATPCNCENKVEERKVSDDYHCYDGPENGYTFEGISVSVLGEDEKLPSFDKRTKIVIIDTEDPEELPLTFHWNVNTENPDEHKVIGKIHCHKDNSSNGSWTINFNRSSSEFTFERIMYLYKNSTSIEGYDNDDGFEFSEDI